MAKRGRPFDPNARRREYRLRINDDEYSELVELGKRAGMAMSDVIRKSLELFKNDLERK